MRILLLIMGVTCTLIPYKGMASSYPDGLSVSSNLLKDCLEARKSRDPLRIILDGKRVTIVYGGLPYREFARCSRGRSACKSGFVDQRFVERLDTILKKEEGLFAYVNTPSQDREYIIAGYKTGAPLAALTARKIRDCLGETFIKNQIKVFGFYPYPVGDINFCYDLCTDLGPLNVLYINLPKLFSLPDTFLYPGISMDVAYTEYLSDNIDKVFGIAAVLMGIALAVVSTCDSGQRTVASTHNSWQLSNVVFSSVVSCVGGVFSYLYSSVKLNSSTLEKAHDYVCENRQMYHQDISNEDLGKMPLISVRRGVGKFFYKKFFNK